MVFVVCKCDGYQRMQLLIHLHIKVQFIDQQTGNYAIQCPSI